MRLFVILPVAVLVIFSTVLGLASMSRVQAAAARRAAENAPRTGMDILNAHTCGRGETKRIIVRGVEDGFSPAGEEPGFIREGRNHAQTLPPVGDGEYDQVNVDQHFTDSFKIDGRISSGVFLIRLRALNDSDNDTLSIGNLTIDPQTGTRRPFGGLVLSQMPADRIWTRHGDIVYGDIDQIPFGPVERGFARGRVEHSLKSYLNDPASPGWLDVFVQDDTAVDFMGVALCYPPAVVRGTTLMPLSIPELTGPEMIHLTCHNTRNRADRCNPYAGNQVCSAMLPVACLRPGNAPAPAHSSGHTVLVWSGAEIAVTEPVRPDRFRSVRDVEAFCTTRFGPGWRVANLNDGIRYQAISGLGDPRTVTGPVWVDVVDQPHATCWKRE